MCLFPAQALPTAEPNPTHNLAYCAFMRFCPQLAVRCPTVHTIHTVLQNEAKATTTTTRHCGSDSKYPLWHLRFSLHFPFNISPVNSPRLPAQPERPYPITLHCHTRTLSPSSRSPVREKELRAAPEYVERPLCPAPLLPFCSFIAILHAQSADLADYADYGKYTQTQTSTHTHILILYRGTTLS